MKRIDKMGCYNAYAGKMLISICIALAVFLGSGYPLSWIKPASAALPPHLDRMKNRLGCSACHRGHGKRGSPMLKTSLSSICFSCHGPTGMSHKDIATVFMKRYRHPVDTTADLHSQVEELPEKSHLTARHVACQDCHNSHETTKDKIWKNVHGYSKVKKIKRDAEHEYEICMKCHSDSANLPSGARNKMIEFGVGSESYHPVMATGRNKRVPSLKQPLDALSMISCSDCHGNNNTLGAEGPHASDYQFILKFQYIMREGPESEKAYELCYACHERHSLLDNESFKRHKEHVVYQRIPCSACHTPHGSSQNQHLIEFDKSFTGSGMPTYMPSPSGRPLCMLVCHLSNKDVKHDNAFYENKKWP